MTKIQNTPNRAAFDLGTAQDVRAQLQKDPQQGLKAAAQQFETMFLQMVLKSMRDTVPQDGLLASDQSRFYTGLLDQQMAQNISTTGGGLGFARLIEQQLGRHLGQPDALADAVQQGTANAAAPALPLAASAAQHLRAQAVPSSVPTSAAYAARAESAASAARPEAAPGAAGNPADFVNRVWPHAVDASRSTGIPPQFLVAHAALETGWGRSELRRTDGSPTHNLFGIKAGRRWEGEVVEARTTEYVAGEAQTATERFRAYGSYAEAFQDYAQLLRNHPRFSAVIGAQDGTEFAKRLQQAGYATDPQYADKLARIIQGPTLRQALIG